MQCFSGDGNETFAWNFLQVIETLDRRKGYDRSYLWPPEPAVDPDANEENNKESESIPADQTLEEEIKEPTWEDQPVLDRLQTVLKYLRTQHFYCLHCGCQVSPSSYNKHSIIRTPVLQSSYEHPLENPTHKQPCHLQFCFLVPWRPYKLHRNSIDMSAAGILSRSLWEKSFCNYDWLNWAISLLVIDKPTVRKIVMCWWTYRLEHHWLRYDICHSELSSVS